MRRRRTATIIEDIDQRHRPFGWEMMEAFRHVVELAKAHISSGPQESFKHPGLKDITAVQVWLKTRGLWPLHDEEIAEYEEWLAEYHPDLARDAP